MSEAFFLPYQQRWLKDTSRFKCWEKSRRIGATYCQAYEDVRDCVEETVKNVYFSSADESAAKEYIDDCANWAKVFNVAFEVAGEIVLDEKKDVNALQIRFSNGTKINALTSNPKRFRSKGGKVVLDEFAFHEDAKELWKAAKPAVTWGFPVRILSTHNGTHSFYNEHFVEAIKQGKLKNWSLHTTPVDQAINEGLVDKIYGHPTTKQERDQWLEETIGDLDDEDAGEEYYCRPSDEKSAYLTYEELAAVESGTVTWPGTEIPEFIDGDLYIGFDVARKKDLSAIWINEKIGDMLFTRKLIILEKTLFRVQRETLYRYMKHPKFRRACIDATGIGMQLAEDAQLDFGKYRVEPVMFTESIKESLAIGLRLQIEDKRMLIPAKAEIRDDLHSIRKVVTKAGHIRFSQEGDTDGHADRFWAAALACEAAKSYSGPINVQSTGRRDQHEAFEAYDSGNHLIGYGVNSLIRGRY